MQIQRLLTNICSDNLPQSQYFYTQLFDFKVAYESDWFIQLVVEGSGLELGIILRDHAVVPEPARVPPQGVYLTFVVEDADRLFAVATEEGFDILSAPEDTFYGQRRLLLQDPSGTVIDISSPIANG